MNASKKKVKISVKQLKLFSIEFLYYFTNADNNINLRFIYEITERIG